MPELDVQIKHKHLKVGLKDDHPFLDEDLQNTCSVDESMWMVEDNQIHILLIKTDKSQVWTSACLGHEMQERASDTQCKNLTV